MHFDHIHCPPFSPNLSQIPQPQFYFDPLIPSQLHALLFCITHQIQLVLLISKWVWAIYWSMADFSRALPLKKINSRSPSNYHLSRALQMGGGLYAPRPSTLEC